MIISSTEKIPNKEIAELLGIARGSTIRARSIGNDICIGLESIAGGDIEEYNQLQALPGEQALKQRIEDAERLCADAVVNNRITSSMVMRGPAEILIYETTVKLS